MTPNQHDLFAENEPGLPEGLLYRRDVLTVAQEQDLLEAIRGLDLRPFAFRGYLGHRRTLSYGWHYSFEREALEAAEVLPDFLLPARAVAAKIAGLAPEALAHALVTHYAPGAGIGWHRDKRTFDVVVGLSLGAACPFRLRRKRCARWERARFIAEPRSGYVLTGPARWDWEHSIAPVEAERWSVTFRSLG